MRVPDPHPGRPRPSIATRPSAAWMRPSAARPGVGRGGAWALAAATAFAAGLHVAGRVAVGQVVVATPAAVAATSPADGADGDAADAAAAQPQKGFSLRKEDTKVLDKLSDFRRHAAKKAWEPAFRAFGELADMNLTALVPVGKGLSLPSRQQVWRALAELPPEGREAYRLFNDAKAKQLFDRATAPGAADEAATLKTIFDRYFVTSVGDKAADRLGDAAFEAGDFAAADAAWKAILQYQPDPSTPKPRLRAKRCAALARDGRWAEFDAVAAELTAGGAGAEPVVVGGRPVPAAQYVQSLRAAAAEAAASASTQPSATRPATGPSLPTTPAGPLALPATNAPLWQCRFGDDSPLEKTIEQMRQQGWFIPPEANGPIVPPSATDGRRVYLNWLGVAFAVDLQTGKLLWRSRKFGDVGANAQSFVQNGLNLSKYGLTLAGGGTKVLITGVPFGDLNGGSGRGGPACRMVCHAADTGAVVWATMSGTASGYSMAGAPLAVGDVVYAAAQKSGQQEMHLIALELATGKLLWTASLGTPQAGTDYRGTSQAPPPTLAAHGGAVYVLTNNGALVAVDVAARQVAWALSYDPPPIPTGEGMIFFSSDSMNPPPKPGRGAMAFRGSTLFLKETNGPALHAVDLGGPSVAWSRPADADATVVGVDDRTVYLLGQEMVAIDTNTRALRWGTKVPPGSDQDRVLRGPDSIYVYAGRGVFPFEAGTGDPAGAPLRPFDTDALGGAVWRTPDRLVTVSNVAVTAYPVRPASNESK